MKGGKLWRHLLYQLFFKFSQIVQVWYLAREMCFTQSITILHDPISWTQSRSRGSQAHTAAAKHPAMLVKRQGCMLHCGVDPFPLAKPSCCSCYSCTSGSTLWGVFSSGFCGQGVPQRMINARKFKSFETTKFTRKHYEKAHYRIPIW